MGTENRGSKRLPKPQIFGTPDRRDDDDGSEMTLVRGIYAQGVSQIMRQIIAEHPEYSDLELIVKRPGEKYHDTLVPEEGVPAGQEYIRIYGINGLNIDEFWGELNEKLEEARKGDPSTELNKETSEFLSAVVKKLVSNYRERYLRSQNMAGHLATRDLSQFPNAEQLIQDRKDYMAQANEMAQRAEAVQKFPGAVARVVEEKISLPMPEFLVSALASPANEFAIEVVNELLDEKGLPLEKTGQGGLRTGTVSWVFPGRQFKLLIKYGKIDETTKQIVPTREPISMQITPYAA